MFSFQVARISSTFKRTATDIKCHDETHLHQKALLDRTERFALWVCSLGACRSPSDLDHRLQMAHWRVSSRINELLVELESLLQKGTCPQASLK